MAKRDAFTDMLRDMLAPLGAIVIKPMFSGAGVYADGQFFALVFDGKLYLKSDAGTAPRFDAEGLQPFSYTAKSKVVTTSYRQAPERFYDDPDEMLDWAREAVRAAARSKAGKPTNRSSRGGPAADRPAPKGRRKT